MAGPRPASDVDVLAKLDVTFRPQNHEAPIAPGAEAVRREPVDPRVTAATIAAKDYVAEVLELRPLRKLPVRHLRRDHLRLGRPRHVEELVHLVRGDVGEDPSGLSPLEEPRRAARRADPVGSESHRL